MRLRARSLVFATLAPLCLACDTLHAAPADQPTSPAAQPATPAVPSGPTTVAAAYPPPEGAETPLLSPQSFGSYLRALPVKATTAPILTHDGRVVPRRARVIDLPMVPGDLQQCADSLMRLRATWQLDQGQSPSFHATSGDPMPFSRYKAGEVPYETGGRIAWKAGGDRSLTGWMTRVFIWAGTASLHRHDTVADATPDPGDLLLTPGFPGHTVILLDVATRGEDTFVLLGQGFSPAQSFHVPEGPHNGWWRYDDGVRLPYWDFDADSLRRWKH